MKLFKYILGCVAWLMILFFRCLVIIHQHPCHMLKTRSQIPAYTFYLTFLQLQNLTSKIALKFQPTIMTTTKIELHSLKRQSFSIQY
jgi:hypothetical protein